MFLRATTRKKDGKEHRYFSVVENKRVSGGRVLQRHVLYLGEINSSQELAWRRSIEVLDEGTRAPRTLSLFPEGRCEGVVPDESILPLPGCPSMRLNSIPLGPSGLISKNTRSPTCASIPLARADNSPVTASNPCSADLI